MAMSSYRNYFFPAFLAVLLLLFYLLNMATQSAGPAKRKVIPKQPLAQQPVAKAKVSPPKERSTSESSQKGSGAEKSFGKELNDYAGSILRDLPKGEKRDDVIIRYYPHSSDMQLVAALENLGFYVHRRPTDSLSFDQKSNSLFYGDNVKLLDIQLVARSLIQNGVNLKQIKPSLYHDDWKKNSIEIGADIKVNDSPVMTIEQIAAIKK